MRAPFPNRATAGRELAQALGRLALPRGGVPVASEVARALGAPLDVLLVRKIGCEWQPELAVGAIASGGIVVHEAEIERSLRLAPEAFERVAAVERAELARREQLYRAGRPPLQIQGRPVIIVDDGIATGASMRAACQAAHAAGAVPVIAAAPVAAPRAVERLHDVADAVVTVHTPAGFSAVGEWYEDFAQLGDDDVRALLRAEPRA